MTENCLFQNNDKFFNWNIGENRNENENCHQWKMAINNNSVSIDRLIVFVSKVCQFVFFSMEKYFQFLLIIDIFVLKIIIFHHRWI